MNIEDALIYFLVTTIDNAYYRQFDNTFPINLKEVSFPTYFSAFNLYMTGEKQFASWTVYTTKEMKHCKTDHSDVPSSTTTLWELVEESSYVSVFNFKGC